jgi:transposase
MFFRVKPSGPRRYLQIVENRRVEGAVRQTVIATLGRLDELQASGALTALMASGAKFVDQIVLLDALAGDESSLCTKRIGAPLLFGRLWRRLGIDAVLDKLAGERAFEFAIERAIFVATLHRLLVSGSDRDCDAWRADYDIAGTEGLKLHHFYRAMAWLGEELEAKVPGALAPRCLKDVIEEALFDANRSLFTQVRAVFMDTTSLSFYGEGGETLGERGYSKDYRPDLHQMILALVMDGTGRPLCTEMVPGNTADVTTLLPVVDRLRQRFCIDEVCVVADRGMISAPTIAALEARKLTYILGTRERTDTTARALVLDDQAPFVPLVLERQRRGQTQLFIKKRVVAGKTYIVCRNEEEAEHDRRERQALVEVLDAQLKRGDKALIGNAGYRRYLRKADAKAGASFEIDAGKLAEEARFDGIFVLRTNANLTPLQVVMRYRDLLLVENLFQRTKAVMRTRPIFHSSDQAIRGHVFCSFLALVLRKELDDILDKADLAIEWADLKRGLDRLLEARLVHKDKDWLIRTDAEPAIASLFRAAQIALPPRARQTSPPPPQPMAAPKRRRGRPKRGATSA